MNTRAVQVIRVPGWEEYEWLRHGFSSRSGGLSTVYGSHDLNLGFTKDDDPRAVEGNRALLLDAVGGDQAGELVTVRQVHGTVVKTVNAGEQGLRAADGRALIEADGLMTAAPGVMLGIQAADCVPVLLVDVTRRVVAAIHAGWRGTAAGIMERGIARMLEEFGSLPGDLVGAVGPAIGSCCYTVGEEVRETFAANFSYAEELFQRREDGLHLDLAEANRRQMLGAGLDAGRVTLLGECTACTRVGGERRFFSHRAEKGFTGRAMGMIGIAAKSRIHDESK